MGMIIFHDVRFHRNSKYCGQKSDKCFPKSSLCQLLNYTLLVFSRHKNPDRTIAQRLSTWYQSSFALIHESHTRNNEACP